MPSSLSAPRARPYGFAFAEKAGAQPSPL